MKDTVSNPQEDQSSDEEKGIDEGAASEGESDDVDRPDHNDGREQEGLDEDSEQEEVGDMEKKKTKVFGDKWLAETGNFNEKLKKRGVLYVARIPPRMTPTKLKTLLGEYGEVCRVYLVEEDKAARKRRRMKKA